MARFLVLLMLTCARYSDQSRDISRFRDRDKSVCANFTEASIHSVIIQEVSPIGTEVYQIPTFSRNASAPSRIFIDSTTNKNEKFDVNNSGTVYLSGYLDHDIDQEFDLSVFSLEPLITGDKVCLKHRVHVTVEDNSVWPPNFNESCCFCNGYNKRPRDYPFFVEILFGEARVPLEETTPLVWKDKMFMDSSPSKCSGDLYILLEGLDLQNELLVSNFPRSAVAVRCVDRNRLEEFLAGHTQLLRINDVPTRLQEKTWFSKRRQSQFVRIDFADAFIQRAVDETPVSCKMSFPGLRRAFRTTTVIKVLGCPDGYYGLQCEDVCICKNGAACHVLNGACKCTPGWRGPACDIRHSEVRLGAEYREAYFGEYVLLSATGYNVDLKNDNVKWYLNGSNEFLSGSKDILFSINNR
ncbi:uncharacterized protein [Ptychodera flava]|uniref:uncharacterized protein n=1 Tax=Ptychodera flava TaxID=63121 RepID=UPI003969FC5A